MASRGRGRHAPSQHDLHENVGEMSFTAALEYPPDGTYDDATTSSGMSGSANPHSEPGNHLVGLLRAATSVAGQEQQAPMSEGLQALHLLEPRKQMDEPTQMETSPSSEHARKRKRTIEPQDSVQAAQGSMLPPPVHAFPSTQPTPPPPPHPAPASPFAPALANHSAAPLFRTPSANSKKYTRPPLSTLFTSLGLGPEGFLHLQAAAKSYMLDPQHPERRECVGSRSTGIGAQPSEMVKLRLWNCVKDFLENEGWGERCFGVAAQQNNDNEGVGVKLYWPRDKNIIISRVTPLLRRMVTNERQRLYALETRKGPGAPAGAAASSSGRKRKADDIAASPERARSVGTPEHGFPERSQQYQPFTKRIEFDVWSDRAETRTEEIMAVFDSEVMSLGQQSGLPTNHFDKLVAVVEYHVKQHYYEDSGSRGCEDKCHDAFFVQYFRRKGFVDAGTWGNQSNKIGSARLILRALFHAINRVIASHINPSNRTLPQSQAAPSDDAEHLQKRQRTTAPVPEVPPPASETGTSHEYPHPSPVEPEASSIDPAITSAPEIPQTTASTAPPAAALPLTSSELTLRVSIISPNNKRLLPPFTLSTAPSPAAPEEAPPIPSGASTESPEADKPKQLFLHRSSLLETLRSHLATLSEAQSERPLHVRVLLLNGLKDITSDEEWTSALKEVSEIEWLDREARIVASIDAQVES